jgi:hypothetical protein
VKRLALVLGSALLALASGCGASKHAAAPPPKIAAPAFAKALARTTAAKTVKFAQITSIAISGSKVNAYANGTASFADRLGHVFRIQPGTNVPGETIVSGPFVYENANAQAALSDPTVQPWTKLDTRRLSAKQRNTHPDDLAHALAPAYLAAGVAAPRLVRTTTSRAVFVGVVDPAAVAAHVPVSERSLVAAAVRGDYPATRFPARFWLDARGRLRRVLVTYKTAGGTPVSVDTSYDAFGVPIDATPPPARDVKDVTPKS